MRFLLMEVFFLPFPWPEQASFFPSPLVGEKVLL